jgi:hypothetical protein
VAAIIPLLSTYCAGRVRASRRCPCEENGMLISQTLKNIWQQLV